MVKVHKKDTDFADTIKMMLDERFGRRKTILLSRQVSPITTLDTVAQIYDIKFLKLWVESFSEYKTSEKGKGRDDVVEITKAWYANRKETEDILKELRNR